MVASATSLRAPMAAREFADAFKQIYRNIRAIGLLPSVRAIPHYFEDRCADHLL